MMALAHEFFSMGVRAATFSGGGEPPLHKPLPEEIEILATDGVRIGTLTSDSNLKGRVADVFAAHGTWILISLDAREDESYVNSRGAKRRDYSRLIENIRNFAARETQCVLSVSLIVGHDSHQHILEVCSLLKDCGVNHVKVSGAAVSNDAVGDNSYHRRIKDEVERQIATAQALTDTSFPFPIRYHDLEDRFEKKSETFPFLQFFTVMGADQHVYTCQEKTYTPSGRVDPIAFRSLKEFWFSEESQQFLKTFDTSVQCAHHCVNHGKNLAIHEYLSPDQKYVTFV